MDQKVRYPNKENKNNKDNRICILCGIEKNGYFAIPLLRIYHFIP